ncbi:hypothetical protein COO60DRAFT_1522020 [Scenedesmus sp. NREL 46B-D3]|nr:hypothetical protein COO60DRAFT_1522020 [Scenedesmus sp. NREL 46B-D3]
MQSAAAWCCRLPRHQTHVLLRACCCCGSTADRRTHKSLKACKHAAPRRTPSATPQPHSPVLLCAAHNATHGMPGSMQPQAAQQAHTCCTPAASHAVGHQGVSPMSLTTQPAELWPAQPVTEPPGCVPADAEYRPWMGVRYGKRWSKPKALSMWWMCPRLMPKYDSTLGGVSVMRSTTRSDVPGANVSTMSSR